MARVQKVFICHITYGGNDKHKGDDRLICELGKNQKQRSIVNMYKCVKVVLLNIVNMLDMPYTLHKTKVFT